MLRLSMSAEEAKIALSEATSFMVELPYIEQGLSIATRREAYEAAIGWKLEIFSNLAREAVRLAGVQPTLVYVTGGTAKSPIIRKALLDILLALKDEDSWLSPSRFLLHCPLLLGITRRD
ncbi:hypothetical protein DFO67_102102 [Modicisalibacter xianhensis]|uniref:Hsp70 protein n=1 Tax=Modicisalibacter xianhensis TaxID=442341 RepID=A0A4R8G240_9GAMM|nr:hypothetical protein [Halomonas xianhensis]TDX32153.1 hypothetical protein DFO67_102102 [Halomonas xianhensis]